MERSWALHPEESLIIVKEVFITPTCPGLDLRSYIPKFVVAPSSEDNTLIPTKRGVSMWVKIVEFN